MLIMFTEFACCPLPNRTAHPDLMQVVILSTREVTPVGSTPTIYRHDLLYPIPEPILSLSSWYREAPLCTTYPWIDLVYFTVGQYDV